FALLPDPHHTEGHHRRRNWLRPPRAQTGTVRRSILQMQRRAQKYVGLREKVAKIGVKQPLMPHSFLQAARYRACASPLQAARYRACASPCLRLSKILPPATWTAHVTLV